MSNQWRDNLAGARMQVDQQFNDRIVASQFTNQQWGLIMTAVEFEIENPDDPETAELVANTEQVKHIIPELENLPQGMGGAQMGAGGSQDSGGGLLGRIRGFLTGDSGGSSQTDAETLEAASQLADEYATELQAFLKDQGRWELICESAAASQ